MTLKLISAPKLWSPDLALIMELAHCNLYEVLHNEAVVLPWPLRIKWLKMIAEGQKEMHSMRPTPILHNDLKSTNVVLSCADLSAAVLKITDYGVSTTDRTGTMSQVTIGVGSNNGVGTLGWMSPEAVLEGTKQRECDVYSCGITIFEVMSRQEPFPGMTEIQLRKLAAVFDHRDPNKLAMEREYGVSMHKQQELWNKQCPLASRRPNLDLVDVGCPEELKRLAVRCWADDPRDRPDFKECVELLHVMAQRGQPHGVSTGTSATVEWCKLDRGGSWQFEKLDPAPGHARSLTDLDVVRREISNTTDFPAEFEGMAGNNFRRVPVSEVRLNDVTLWERVKERVKLSLPDFEVVKITRLQNKVCTRFRTIYVQVVVLQH